MAMFNAAYHESRINAAGEPVSVGARHTHPPRALNTAAVPSPPPVDGSPNRREGPPPTAASTPPLPPNFPKGGNGLGRFVR